MSTAKKTAQFSITEENYWRLKEIASRDKKTLSVFLRDAVEAYLQSRNIEINLSDEMESWGGNRRSTDEQE